MGDPYLYISIMIKFFAPLFIVAMVLYWRKFLSWKKFIFAAAILGIFMFTLEVPALNWNAWGYNFENTIGRNPLAENGVIETLVWSILLVAFLSMVLIVLVPKVESNTPFFVPRFVMNRIKSKKLKEILGRYF